MPKLWSWRAGIILKPIQIFNADLICSIVHKMSALWIDSLWLYKFCNLHSHQLLWLQYRKSAILPPICCIHSLFIIPTAMQAPTMASLLVVLFIVLLGNCGRIYSGDLAVDYANAGKMTQLSFTFMLSSSINSDDYLKVALPFPFHSQLTPAVPAMEGLSSPSLLTVTYQSIDAVTQALGTAYNTFVLTETIDRYTTKLTTALTTTSAFTIAQV